MDENRIYTTVQGDMWDSIAYQFYGDVKYIGLLLQNNADLLEIYVFSNEGLYPEIAGRRRRRRPGMEIVKHEGASIFRNCII